MELYIVAQGIVHSREFPQRRGREGCLYRQSHMCTSCYVWGKCSSQTRLRIASRTDREAVGRVSWNSSRQGYPRVI